MKLQILVSLFSLITIAACSANQWDSYIESLMTRTRDRSGQTHCDKACIIQIDGGALLTSAGNANELELKGQEGANIAKCFKSGDFSPFQASGIRVGGIKYYYLREIDGKIVLGQKKGHGGITLQASKKAIIIAHVPEGGQQGKLNKAVDAIAEQLETLGV